MLFVSLFHFRHLNRRLFRNERGQGLIEYLVIVALVGIASISIMRVIGQNVRARFGNISAALGSGTKAKMVSAESSTFEVQNMKSFMNGSGTKGGSRGSNAASEDVGE